MKQFLEFYFEHMQSGEIPCVGLCSSLYPLQPFPYAFNLIEPTIGDEWELEQENLSTVYWGSGLSIDAPIQERRYKFTPLRQNLVLLLAAINEEL